MPSTYPDEGTILLDGWEFKLASSGSNAQTGAAEPGRLQVQELGTFPRKVTIGDQTLSSQDFLSTWALSDLSGGHGLSDHQTDATISRYRYSTMDVSRPLMWTQRPRVTTKTGTSAAFCPLGDLFYSGNTDFYGTFGTDLHIWNESTDTWTDTTHNLTAAPVHKGTAFQGTGTLKLFIPMGASGYATYTGASFANVAASGSAPAARDFAIIGTILVCLDTSGQLWTTSDGTTWENVGEYGKVDGSVTAHSIQPYRDGLGNSSLVITTNNGLYVFDPSGPTMYKQDLQYPMHPDQGLASTEWRGIFHTSVGMGVHTWNSATGTIDAMGLDRDEGLPYLYNYNCRIADFAPAYNEMYALVQGSTPDSTFPTVHRWTGKGWHAVWEASGTATVTRITVSNARNTYRVWWGAGNTSYTVELPRGFTNPKQMSVHQTANLLSASGYIETGLSDMGMPGYRKMAHSARVRISYLSTSSGSAPPTLYYRIRDGDSWTEVYRWAEVWASGGGEVVPYETFHFAFGGTFNSATGVGFDEIELRLLIPDQYAIVKFLTLDFKKIPKQNRSWQAVFDLTAPYGGRSPAAMEAKLDSLIIAETVVPMVHRKKTRYVSLASWNGMDNTGDSDDRGVRTVQIIETRFVQDEAGKHL